ncbi:MAG TPA: twin-arginine translocase TatA/TatE family subunit [Patescibacteria group bacterium]|jgi:TatA/E family protein of Tat protein translocase
MLQNIGTLEVLIIAAVILLLFGARKLPEFARGIAEAKKEFKKSFESDAEKDKKE